MQSKRHSLMEAVLNVLIGYWIAIATQMAVFPLFGIHIPLEQDLLIGLIFTVVSLVRSYALRRVFNRWHERTPVYE
jgi:hypothetical protein